MNIAETIVGKKNGPLNKTAIIDQDQTITYETLFKEVALLRAELSALGVSDYKKVALYAEDSIEYIIVSLAVLLCNGVIVPVSPSLAWDEAQNVMDAIDVHFLIAAEKIGFHKKLTRLKTIKCNRREMSFYRRAIKNEAPKEYYALNPAFIRFSSGTTGASKGVVLSHDSIIERIDAANKGLNITECDHIIWVLSMTYHFVVTILLFLRERATIILCEKEFPFTLFDALKKYSCTFLYASPFHYRMISLDKQTLRGKLSNIRLAISTAVEFSKEEIGLFHDAFGCAVKEAYGIIEVGLPFINLSHDLKARGSVGKILPDYDIQILNKDDEGVGAIYLRGKGMFDAYYSPWKMREKVLVDGWFYTGDIGFLDENNYLFIKGREKNVINFSGMKIFPAEVEAVLNSHPKVRESFVYGVSHPVYGQLPQADVIWIDESRNSNALPELRKFCYDHMASYKVPKKISFVDKIKKTASGKISRSNV
ncbi:MAG: acyl--CoA ligase [Candidatus Omnitrophica bacterium]|nr:acyl--CoA ligase [Candidatus Omnitrophota bacterium]